MSAVAEATTVFVPPISSVLTVAEPWSFTLYNESRNHKFINSLRKVGILPNEEPPIYPPGVKEAYDKALNEWMAAEPPQDTGPYAWTRVGDKKHDAWYKTRPERPGPTAEWRTWNQAYGRYGGTYGQPICKLTLPEDTELKVARIYIRCGKGEYDSITFNANFKALVDGKEKKVTGRFWARLSEVNKLQVKKIVAGATPKAPKVSDLVEVKGKEQELEEVEVVLSRKFNFTA